MKKIFTALKAKFTSPKIIFLFLCICYVIIASLQSLAQHYQFLTSNWDLGFHNQLMYKFAHFKSPGTTLWNSQYPLTFFLGDHVTFLMPLNSQLYWLFGSYALLVAQILYGLVGALGIYKLIEHKFQSANFALAGVFIFFTHYSLYAALDFDDHDNVYGMMFLPWILFFYYKNNFKWFLISLGIFLIARDDLSLTAIMLGFCFLIFDWKEKRKYAFACILISGAYFVLAHKIIIPYFSPLPDGGYAAWRFSHLGNSMSDVMQNAIINPGRFISLMFDTIEKQEKLKYFLYTGGILFFIRPQFALLVVPTFFTTCLSNSWPLWGNMYHYNILFSVLLPFVIISAIHLVRSTSLKYILLIPVIWLNLHYLNKNFFRDWSTFDRIFTSEYYHQRPNQKEIEEAISMIPENAAVSASNHYTPHLAFRDKIYFFPDVKDAEYVAINEMDGKNRFFPFENSEKFMQELKHFRENQEWKIVYEKNQMIVFKRRE